MSPKIGDHLSRFSVIADTIICATGRWGGVDPDHRLHKVSFGLAFRDRIDAAGVRRFTPHDLRRTFAGDLLDEGHDIVKVQRAMGHSSPAMTARYDRRPLASRREMAESIVGPRRRRLRAVQ